MKVVDTVLLEKCPSNVLLLKQRFPRRSSGFPGGSEGKASAYNEGDLASIPGSGRSPGEGNGNPLQDFATT